MHGPLGKPELVPVQTKAIVQSAGVLPPAYRADVSRVEWVEPQQRAVDGTSAARPAEERLFTRHVRRRIHDRRKLRAEPRCQLDEVAADNGAPG